LYSRLSGAVSLNRRLKDQELTLPATLIIKATQINNHDRYAVTTLTVNR